MGITRVHRIGPGAVIRHRKIFRAWRRILAGAITVLVVFVLVSARLFVWPAQGMPPRVSAIVMLAGPGGRLPEALRLARQGRAPMLIISRGWQGYGGPCPRAVPHVKLVCFNPDPGNTRGEAQVAGHLAETHHWNSMVLVTSTVQDTRARMIVGRCFGGPVYVVTAPLPLSSWPYEVVYEWGALLKALVLHRSC